MIATVIGIVFIVAGVMWMVLAWFAAGMASRQVDFATEVLWPMSWGLVPILLGLALVFS